MIQGNIQGVRQSYLDTLEGLFSLELPQDEFVPQILLQALAAFTGHTGREVSVYLKRDGVLAGITIGDQFTVPLEEMHLRRNHNRLAGVRCIHTHPGGNAVLSDIDIQSLKKLKLDAMVAIGVKEDGSPSAITCAFVEPDVEQGYVFHGPYGIYQIPQEELLLAITEVDARVKGESVLERTIERAILVGLGHGPTQSSLQELRRLAETAGAEVACIAWQNAKSPETATYIGSGKAEEIALQVQAMDCDLVIFDDELTGAQVRNLETILGAKVIDRAMLILDIFAQRAQSREGKLQVELAQLKYKLPRLIGSGLILSRLGAGIGTRGPGESKLEVDRRRIRERISFIGHEIEKIKEQRAQRRARRERNQTPVVALVGYTNAGKSTLLNQLTGASVWAVDQLFATLDTTTRSIELPGGAVCLLTDTVGFIDKLPHDLVTAFRSTLEEAMYADLLVIVCDASSPDVAKQQKVVDEALVSLGAGDKPRVFVMNKSDKEPGDPDHVIVGSIPICAKSGEGLDLLLTSIEQALGSMKNHVEILIPYSQGAALAYLHSEGGVEEETYEEGGTKVQAKVDDIVYAKVLRMIGN